MDAFAFKCTKSCNQEHALTPLYTHLCNSATTVLLQHPHTLKQSYPQAFIFPLLACLSSVLFFSSGLSGVRELCGHEKLCVFYARQPALHL